MLLIRDSQMEAFRRAALERTELDLVRHFTRFYPRECLYAGGDGPVLTLVRRAIERAAEHGYTGRGQIYLYTGLMFMLGDRFDRDPQIPWAGAQLDDVSIPNPTLRIEELYKTAVNYLGATAGEDCELIVRAMLRLRAFDPEHHPRTTGEEWDKDVCARLGELYPEKYKAQGEEPTRAMVHASAERAALYGVGGPKGRAVYATLSFMLGSGFHRDLLYPWAARALEGGGGEAAMVDRLYRAAMRHLNESLSGK